MSENMISRVVRRLFQFDNWDNLSGQYTELDTEKLILTIEKLSDRITERFPESGLSQVSKEFILLAKLSEVMAMRIGRPIWPIRIAAFLAVALFCFVIVGLGIMITQRVRLQVGEIGEILQATEAAINELIFIAIALYFIVNLETRLKRRAVLEAMHKLRSLSHVVDMHQLTKDPAYLLNQPVDTPASPTRFLSRYELTRYLDYCSEILALVSKVAALFAQNMADPVILDAVNDLESLTQRMSAKIWQKIMILDLAVEQKKEW